MKVVDHSSLPFHERCVVLLDQYPWSIGTRIGFGSVIPYVFHKMCDIEQPFWCVIGSFLAILFLLRVASAVVRRLVPFSEEAQRIWRERRQLAKRFDSYQWQKLFWMGIGMAGYATIYGNVGKAIGALMALLLIGGGLGVLLWVRRHGRQLGVNIG